MLNYQRVTIFRVCTCQRYPKMLPLSHNIKSKNIPRLQAAACASWQAKRQRSTEVSPMKCFSRMMGGLAQNCERSNAEECQGSEQCCQQCGRVAPGTTIRREQLLRAASTEFAVSMHLFPGKACTSRLGSLNMLAYAGPT